MTRRVTVWWSALVAATLASSVAAESRGDAASSEHDRFATGVQALQRGAFDQAIDEFELLADRGFTHPDASFNRGVAYVARARSSEARTGDLGRAAAGFSEALTLRPGDAVAERALQRLRIQIREQSPIVSHRLSLNSGETDRSAQGARDLVRGQSLTDPFAQSNLQGARLLSRQLPHQAGLASTRRSPPPTSPPA